MSPSLSLGLSTSEVAASARPAPDRFKGARILVLKSHEIDDLARSLTAGSAVELVVVDKPEFVKRLIAGDYDAIIIGYSVTLRDIDYLSIFFNSKSLHNIARIESDAIDSVIRNGWLAQSASVRRESFKTLLKFNSTEAYYLPLAHCPLVFALSSRVKSEYRGSINTTILDLSRLQAEK